MSYCYSVQIDKPCHECKYSEYDSFHNETFCAHKPSPDGLGFALVVEDCGTCEYWEKMELPLYHHDMATGAWYEGEVK